MYFPCAVKCPGVCSVLSDMLVEFPGVLTCFIYSVLSPPPPVIKYLTQCENAMLAMEEIQILNGVTCSQDLTIHTMLKAYIKEASGNI